jgi:hypothetical protein
VCVSIHICQQPNRTDLLDENHYPATLLGFPADLAAACASLLCTMHSMFSQSLQRIYTDGVKALQRAAKASIIVCIVCMLFLVGVLFLYRSTNQVTVQASTACKRVDRALVSQAAVATMLLLLLLLLSQAVSPRLTIHARFRTTTASPSVAFCPQDTVHDFILRYAASQPVPFSASVTCTGRRRKRWHCRFRAYCLPKSNF